MPYLSLVYLLTDLASLRKNVLGLTKQVLRKGLIQLSERVIHTIQLFFDYTDDYLQILSILGLRIHKRLTKWIRMQLSSLRTKQRTFAILRIPLSTVFQLSTHLLNLHLRKKVIRQTPSEINLDVFRLIFVLNNSRSSYIFPRVLVALLISN